MRVFAISDLHLSGAVEKPMDVFGPVWDDHAERIASNWDSIIDDSDLVLIPGDISWAMTLEEAKPDLAWIADRPGRKVILRGNHDYWWTSISKVRRALPDHVYALQNDSIAFESVVVCGTRGWTLPGSQDFDDHDQKICAREILRLRMSLESASKKAAEIAANGGQVAVKIAMIHYPPILGTCDKSEFAQILDEYGISHCVYGHLHGEGTGAGICGLVGSVHYTLVSADYLGFVPRLVIEM